MAEPVPARPGRAAKKVLIVDDHPVLRRGLAALIDAEPGLVVCGEAASVDAALAAVREHPPDVAIVDLALDRSDGLDLVRRLSADYPRVLVLVLSMHDENVYGERALRAGARGYVSKHQLGDTLLRAIEHVLQGGTALSPNLKEQLAMKCLGRRTPVTGAPVELLSDRQLQVFRRIGEGRSTRRIAEELHVSIKTVESHCANIKTRLQIRTATELAHLAVCWVQSENLR